MLRSVLAAISAAAIIFSPSGVAQAAADPPSPPTDVEAVPDNAAARVTWTAPVDDGGSPIQYYTVTADPGPATCTTGDDSTKCTVVGLSNGTAYTFTVTATNHEDLTSKPSEPSAPVTPYTIPDPPTLAFLWASDQTLQARWWVSGDGGSALLDYTATAEPGGQSCTVGADNTSCNIGSLTNGQTYSVTVRARNAAGYSAPSNTLTNSPYGAPSMATGVTATAAKNSAVVTWIAPTDDGGRPLSYYRVTTDGRDCISSSTTCTVTGLLAGRAYQFQVLSYNTGGRSSVSDKSNAVILSGGPAGPDGGPTLVGWGRNEHGEIGDGTADMTTSPRSAYLGGDLGNTYIAAVTGGWEHACALDLAGSVYCWGDAPFSDGTAWSAAPFTQPGMPGAFSQLAAGLDFTCGISDGRAYCWGINSSGQLGTGSYLSSVTPQAVRTDGVLHDKTLTSLAAGRRHMCAIDVAGQAYCWGANGSGQLGTGERSASIPAPVAVTTSGVLAGFHLKRLASGDSHTCAANAEGDTFCWGAGIYGQLGNGDNQDSAVPVVAGRVSGRDLAAGAAHTCAVDAQAQVRCWGNNLVGQIGDGTTTDRNVPVPVAAGPSTAVATSSMSTCAIAADGSAHCWGEGRSGELGDGSGTYSYSPVVMDTSGVLADKVLVDIAGSSNSFHALAASAPDAPGAVNAAPGDAAVTVIWSAPADHGSPIDAYRVVAEPGGTACTTVETSCVLGALTNGTTYRFTITAHNLAGWGLAATSDPVTPKAPPPQPTPAPGKVKGLRAKVGAKAVRVQWQAAPGAGDYQYRIRPPRRTYGRWHTTAKERLIIRHPKQGPYRVQVRARNASGTGPVATVRFRVRR
ncbi:MAG: fibronectin type III domain-containing protein [Candidatus Nanopelagicales bacterium]|nr:fibronectin type III domain-containing protein [Candidatus Nanopelagicales bacterium]